MLKVVDAIVRRSADPPIRRRSTSIRTVTGHGPWTDALQMSFVNVAQHIRYSDSDVEGRQLPKGTGTQREQFHAFTCAARQRDRRSGIEVQEKEVLIPVKAEGCERVDRGVPGNPAGRDLGPVRVLRGCLDPVGH
ncbi:hypothetical protein [Streptomyces sp. NPDC051662]|uniref:hypothetical protein n=1 Tax=Streptomyces sp. NPDC051662 TaxID=3154750 RepID=UPI00341B5A93